MAASRAGIILLFVFIFYCCLSFIVGGGIWYYYKKPETPEKLTDYTNNRRTNLRNPGPPKSKIITTYSASACQTAGALIIDTSLACNDGVSVAGITWTWGVDAQSYKCQQECGGYTVTAVSAELADVVLKQTIKDGAQTGTGITGMPPPWYQGAITFTIMPFDKKGKKLLQIPVSKNVNIAQDNAACKQVGVHVYVPVPHWNENKNLIGVHVDNKGGNFSGYAIARKEDDINSDLAWYNTGDTELASGELSDFLKYGALALSVLPPPGFGVVIAAAVTAATATQIKVGSGAIAIVPKGGLLTILCDGHIAGWQSWNNKLTWDYMMANGAAKAGYKFTANTTCWGGDALAGEDYYPGGW